MIRLALRNLGYFWRTHLGVVLGAACAAAVLVGALAVGDSVRLSLGAQARDRIGSVGAALVAGDRKFTAGLADRIGPDLGRTVAPVLSTPGIARLPGAGARAGIVEVYGVDDRFFAFSPGGPHPAPQAGKAFLDARLADQLGVGAGDTVLVRIEKPSVLPRDMLMATVDDISFALRLEVEKVLTDAGFGRFSLRASQIPPFNVFVSLAWLQGELDLENRANLLLAGGAGPGDAGQDGAAGIAGLVRAANTATRAHWTIADAELRVRTVAGVDELTSRRVFLDRGVAAAVRELQPGALGILTYFVNHLRAGDRATPYSTVTAVGPLDPAAPPRDPGLTQLLDLLPAGGDAKSLTITQWLADDLQAGVGDAVELRYFVMGPRLQLREEARVLPVRRIVPLAGTAADPSLMPEFPGLADSENCRDWEPGIPVDLERIRDVDEKYWDDHRGTPKAFLPLAAGRELFANRYGDVTAIRGPAGFAATVTEGLPRELDPASLGLFFRDVRSPALESGTSATDFGGLFLGLSVFLIGAALLLTAMLFVFGVEQRANEIGTLLALGLRPARVRRLFLLESVGLATLGSVLGAFLGMGYTRAVLHGLGTLWRDAIGPTAITFHAPIGTVLIGTLVAIAVAVGAIALTLRRVFRADAIALLQSRNGIPDAPRAVAVRHGRISLALAIACPVVAIGLALAAGAGAGAGAGATQASGLFFGAGALLLLGGLALCRLLLVHLGGTATTTGSPTPTLGGLGLRNTGRRPGRSLATIALLASGTFLVAAVQANRLEPPPDASVRSSGTGGFALFGRSTLPVLRNPGTREGRQAFGLDDAAFADVTVVPMRVRDGDDASCLNLSRAQNPRLVGVDPGDLASRGSFSFAATLPPADGAAPARPWELLDADYGPDVVPAVGDAASITWALHKSIGDTLRYVDERGMEFQVRLVGAVANSILQGNLVIAEKHLRARFPSATGYRMFLVDAPAERAAAIAAKLTDSLEDVGLELTSTQDRLRAFQAVQNTYLLIFQVLGGLGLLLGSVGVGMVVLRNALERRSELALLAAVGFRAARVRRLFFVEHGVLLVLGLATGVVAAVFAVLPAAAEVSLSPMLVLVAAVAVSGMGWVFVASAFATRGPLLAALKDD